MEDLTMSCQEAYATSWSVPTARPGA